MDLARFLAALALLATALGAVGAEPLRVAVVPWREAAYLQVLYAPTGELLQRKLGRPVQFHVASDYVEVTQSIAARAADLGIYGPESYVLAKRSQPGIQYLVTCLEPGDRYYSLLITRKDSPIAVLSDLKGRSLGLTDPQSTSGYLMPQDMLRRAGLDAQRDVRVFLLRRHPRVFDAVAQGMTEAGAVNSMSWDEAVQKHGDVFRIVARSEPLPTNAVVAAPHVEAALAARIRDILASARKDPKFARTANRLKGYVVRGDRFYDTIRAVQP